MDFFNRQPQRWQNNEGYEAFSYQITNEPISSYGPEKAELFEKLHYEAQKGKRGVIKRLQKYISKYPKDAVLKNYLFIAYKMKGMDVEAQRILQKTIDQHPDYLFGKTNLAGEYVMNEEFEKVPEILGKAMEIKMLYPDREVFHISEVMSFNRIAFMYFIKINEFDQAEERLDLMKKIEPDESYEQFDKTLSVGRLVESMRSMRERMGEQITVASFPTFKYDATDQPPVLQHKILNSFYQYSIDNFSTTLIDKIMALPRNSLIADLELIVEDSSRRYQWYNDNFDNFDVQQQEFQIHALYFLAALEAKDSLPTVLNFLRQGEDVLAFWFGDYFQERLVESFYFLGQDQLPLLKDFVLESHLFYRARLAVTGMVAQVALHQPQRKSEVVNWYKEVLQYHLDRPDDKGIIDTHFIGWTVSAVKILEAPTLAPIVEKLWNKGWIPEMFMGNLESILEDLNEKEQAHDLEPMPKSIYEFYSDAHKERKVKRVYNPEEAAEMSKILENMHDAPAFKALVEMMKGDDKLSEQSNNFDEYEEVRNTNSYSPNGPMKPNKVGRNAPCPCGSGKKYKRCCINK